MHEVINQLTKTYHSIPNGFWQSLLASGILSPFLKSIKHVFAIETAKTYRVFGLKFTGEQFMYSLVIFFSALIAVAAYLINVAPGNPKIIVLHTAVIAFMSQPIYLYLIKPIAGYLEANFGEAARQLNAAKSAAVPPEGLPVAGTSVSAPSAQQIFEQSVNTEDFSS